MGLLIGRHLLVCPKPGVQSSSSDERQKTKVNFYRSMRRLENTFLTWSYADNSWVGLSWIETLDGFNTNFLLSSYQTEGGDSQTPPSRSRFTVSLVAILSTTLIGQSSVQDCTIVSSLNLALG